MKGVNPMSSTAGEHIRLSIFGESHGAAVGGVIDGLPPGEEVDETALLSEMARRAPGRDTAATQRREEDRPRVLSGVLGGRTTGAPLGFLIENTNTRPQDYEDLALLPRPSHADYTAHVKYKGFEDRRGGGHFSGRLTAPLVFAGALSKQILARRGIFVGGHIYGAGGAYDTPFDPCEITKEQLSALGGMKFPVLSPAAEGAMRAEIDAARQAGDSVGGVCELAAVGLPAGAGGPLFGGVESALSALLFGIPGVKGVEFGAGFGIARLRGSQANDAFYSDSGVIKTRTNRSGGIQGGITNGMPVIVRAAFKPTPSVAAAQETVRLPEGEAAEIRVGGRHDPFIARRGLAAAEAAVAFGLLDLICGG